ncbi:Hypothetical predicted protein [Paramuricea clavata]|uniref:Uncharacterized protein n=1 Tax=Paramuricea clavata TaxID=317549 RepID=A0A7D9IDH4_PARCT|nr:Hypothetical predicted protein [Paramuricea clavata]
MSSKLATSPVIGYVHKLSPLKQGKKKKWCDLELQMKDKRMRVVRFSKAKRDIFQEKQETLSPVQISNYLIGPSWQGDEQEIKVNDMTVVSAPTTSQYNFQYIPDEESRLVPLKEVKEKIEAGEKIRVKGKIKKGSKVESVGNRGLRMLKSTITDGTSTMFLTIWESEIDAIQDSKVYIIDDVKVNFSYVTKTLTTTKNSVFTLVDDDDMEEVEESVALQMLEEPSETTLFVQSIRSVEVNKYHTCNHCNKKLSEGLRTKIVKCMRCSHRMRLADCNIDVSCQLTVQEDDSEIQLTIFSDVLGKLVDKPNVNELTEEDISEKLLELTDLEIMFKDDNIVTSCNAMNL